MGYFYSFTDTLVAVTLVSPFVVCMLNLFV